MRRTVAVNINGTKYEHEVEPRLLLVHYIREQAGLTGTHVGCDTSNCGACTVELNGHSGAGAVRIAAKVDVVEYLGHEELLHAQAEGHEIVALVPSEKRVNEDLPRGCFR